MSRNNNAKRNNIRDLKLQLLISESEKQVAQQKLQNVMQHEKSKINVSDFTYVNDEVKRKQKVGQMLIQLLTLIDSNTSLQYLLEIGQLESLTKIFDQGKLYKLLKKIIKPFTLLIQYLLNTNLNDQINFSVVSQKQAEIIPTVQSIQHEHKISFPSTLNKFSIDSPPPEKNQKQQLQNQSGFLKSTKFTQTHNEPFIKKPSEQLEQAPKLKRTQQSKTINNLHMK